MYRAKVISITFAWLPVNIPPNTSNLPTQRCLRLPTADAIHDSESCMGLLAVLELPAVEKDLTRASARLISQD